MKEVTSFRTRNLFNRHVLLSNYGAKLLCSGNEKTMEQNDRKRDHKECYNKKFFYISKHEIIFLLFFVDLHLQHTFRFPKSIIAVRFQDYGEKRRIFVATSDGNIFAVILPESLFKCKGYVMIVMELVR